MATGHERKWNVGVVGKSGSGKSSFINAYLGLDHSDEMAAKTDVVECTARLKSYHLPGSPVVLWDMPGYDTHKVPCNEQYFERVLFNIYDFYVHISSTKIEENEFGIHNKIARQGKRYFYVRTKIDRDLRGQKKGHPKTFVEATEKRKIQEKIEESFPEVPVYLVNCMDREGHDMPTIRATMLHGIEFSISSHQKTTKEDAARARHRYGVAAGCVIQ